MPHNSKDLIFIHIPRTGGSSIEDAYGLTYMRSPVEVPSPQHLVASEVRGKLGKTFWNKSFKFSIVRDPVARLRSDFGLRMSPKPTPPGFPEMVNTEKSFNDFIKFVEKIVASGDFSIHTYDHFRPQYKILDEELDRVFTDLVELQLHFIKKGYPILNKTNSATHLTSDKIMSERNVNLIKKIYEKDIELLEKLK